MKTRYLLAGLCAFALTLNLSAADKPASPLQTAFLGSFNDASGKVVSLAEAFTEEQYKWRPGEGVRSVREAILHVASANFFIATMLGGKIPEGVDPQKLESTVTTKAATIAVLKQSIDVARNAVTSFPEADLGQETNMFGRTVPKMRVVFLIAEHTHEHLGQLIAYARSNSVVPPWSR